MTYSPYDIRLYGSVLARLSSVLFCILICMSSSFAAITFVGINSPAPVSSAINSLSFNAPAATVANDVLLVQISVRGGSGVSAPVPPAGWNIAAARIDNGTNLMQIIYYRVRTAADITPYTWTFNPPNRAMGALIVYRGVDTAAPVNASGGQDNAASTSVTAPAITTTVAGARIVGFFATSNGGASILPPAGMTGRHAMQTGAGPNGVAVSTSDVAQAAAGSTGPKVANSVATSAANIGQLVALRPALTMVTPGRFNVFESSTAAGSIDGVIQTKLAGTAFVLDIVALNTAKTAILTTFTGAVKVELLDASASSGVVDGNNCDASWSTFQTLVTNPIFALADNGRKTASFQVNDARREVRVRVSYPATGTATAIGCSTDNFAIRPTGFTSVTSNMTNTGTTGTPRATAGTGNFTLTAMTGLAHYDGTPKLDNTRLQAHAGAIQNGTLDGDFSMAVGGAATGTAFTYSEIGNFRLLGSVPVAGDTTARGVYDDNFAEVDQEKGECTDDYSNTLSAGKYGCSFGIVANTSYFGRFYPAGFVLSSPVFRNRNDISGCDNQTTGTITASSNALSVGSANGFLAGDTIIVRGAGAGSQDLIAVITGLAGTVLTLNVSAATDVMDATVYKFAFSYQNEPMELGFTITAINGIGTTTRNYTGTAWAAGTVALHAENNHDGIDLKARLATNVFTNWNQGLYALSTANAQFSRSTVPDGPFTSLQIGVSVVDPDGALLQDRNMNPITATDCVALSNCTAVGVGNTRMFFGRLKLANAHGSDRLDLPVPVQAQYWNGAIFAVNTLDSCTTLAASNVLLDKDPLVCTSTVSANASLFNGSGQLMLTKPNTKCRVDLTVNLDPAAEAKTYLQGNWAGATYSSNPTARATFGIYKRGPVIYMREMY